jgi:hypothetical protein
MPGPDIRIEPFVAYKDKVDANNNSISDLHPKILTVVETLMPIGKTFRNIGSIGTAPVVIVNGAAFEFGVGLGLVRDPDQKYVQALDQAIPSQVPKNIPFVLEVRGQPTAAGDSGAARRVVTVMDSNPESTELNRKFYIYDPLAPQKLVT